VARALSGFPPILGYWDRQFVVSQSSGLRVCRFPVHQPLCPCPCPADIAKLDISSRQPLRAILGPQLTENRENTLPLPPRTGTRRSAGNQPQIHTLHASRLVEDPGEARWPRPWERCRKRPKDWEGRGQRYSETDPCVLSRGWGVGRHGHAQEPAGWQPRVRSTEMGSGGGQESDLGGPSCQVA
jgi:hypothetical protein